MRKARVQKRPVLYVEHSSGDGLITLPGAWCTDLLDTYDGGEPIMVDTRSSRSWQDAMRLANWWVGRSRSTYPPLDGMIRTREDGLDV